MSVRNTGAAESGAVRTFGTAARLKRLWADVSRLDTTGMGGGVRSYLLARLLDAAPDRTFVVLAPDAKAAERMHEEICDFAGIALEDDEADRRKGTARAAVPKVALYSYDDLHPFHGTRALGDRIAEAERMGLLYALTQTPLKPRMLIVPIGALLERVVPKAVVAQAADYVVRGVELDRDALLKKLGAGGYQSVRLVETPGDFAVRGAVIDIFPPCLNRPVRIEFDGDIPASIRTFDPVHQKTLVNLEDVHLPPVRQVLFQKATQERFGAELTRLRDELDHHDRKLITLEEEVRQGIWSSDLDQYLPLFYPKLDTLFDYLPADPLYVLAEPDALDLALAGHEAHIAEAYERRRQHGEFLPPAELYVIDGNVIGRRLAQSKRMLAFPSESSADEEERANPHRAETAVGVEDHRALALEMQRARGTAGGLEPLTKALADARRRDLACIVQCASDAQRARLAEMLDHHGVPVLAFDDGWPALLARLADWPRPPVVLVVAETAEGFTLAEDGIAVFAEEQLFGRQARRVRTAQIRRDVFDEDGDLSDGDIVIHEDYGVGIYRGLHHMKFGSVEGDFVRIDYQGNDKLYLPVTRLDRVRKFSSEDGRHPPIDKLGGTSWAKVKERVRESVMQMAQDLLQLYARRQAVRGYAFNPTDEMYRTFEAAFPYEETPDQLKAIEDVVRDMTTEKPMDRLVCGDVGFGKTEVAVRGAFLAAAQGKQVCVLVPTTVLALQHGRTFSKRFEGYPIRVETISRFRTAAETKKVMQELATGQVDVVIGTHRLLNEDVKFKDLGLLVIDEEQRFGVKHKERIKAMKADVDVITLTATPIPRTLHMAFMGLRDMSIIATPPADRHSIRTYVCRFDEETIKEAIEQELNRGGQVYVLHNRVKSIEAIADIIRRLVPQARVAVGHGQMGEHELEGVIIDFMNRVTNVLVCTSIIESGVDIPAANTIVVNRADTFGLAQLYQIRGRVGRSKERAHCYLLVPPANMMTPDAQKRLSVLMRFTELGSGFKVAHHDLELRGTGTLLGEKQSGHINQVGVDLYMKLLEEAIQELKGETAEREIEPEVTVSVPAFIPEDYMPESSHRLVFYRRFNKLRSETEVDALLDEIRDRFGPLRPEVLNLGRVIDIKNIVRRFHAQGVDIQPQRIVLKLGPEARVDPAAAARMVAAKPERYELTPDGKFIVKGVVDKDGELLRGARQTLSRLEAEFGALGDKHAPPPPAPVLNTVIPPAPGGRLAAVTAGRRR